MALTNKLTAIADAIRAKTGGTDLLSLDGMASAVNGIVLGDGAEVQAQLDKVISGTATEIMTNATKIGDYAFYYNRELLSADISKANHIGSSAFSSCYKLKSVALSKTLTELGASAFQECNLLTLSSLPASLTKIKDRVFYNCYDLALTSLPDGITEIGTYAFYNCEELALTSLPSNLTVVKSKAFSKCKAMTVTALPEGLISVEESAFSGCENMTLTSLPESLSTIGGNTFIDCNIPVEELKLPSALTNLGSNAFGLLNNKAITTVTFKSTPTKVDSSAFFNGGNITTINVPWAEGVVSGAPWGATNATINYNYTGV